MIRDRLRASQQDHSPGQTRHVATSLRGAIPGSQVPSRYRNSYLNTLLCAVLRPRPFHGAKSAHFCEQGRPYTWTAFCPSSFPKSSMAVVCLTCLNQRRTCLPTVSGANRERPLDSAVAAVMVSHLRLSSYGLSRSRSHIPVRRQVLQALPRCPAGGGSVEGDQRAVPQKQSNSVNNKRC